MIEPTTTPTTTSCVTTLYNGACPVCRTEIHHYRRIDQRRGGDLVFADIVADPAAAAALGVDPEDLKRRLHVLDREGRLHAGVDAFLVLWRELPGYRWLGRVVGLPGVRTAAALVYDHVLAPVLYAAQKRRERRGGIA
jgi:predicted DCC family thiol-disulfide oxidoreductase YuxK